MPRESFDISTFQHGIVTTVDPQDIPPTSASYSEDVDGDTSDGYLVGRPLDALYDPSYGLYAKDSAFIVNDDGTQDLVYHNKFTGSLSLLRDFYGAKTPSDLIPPGENPHLASYSTYELAMMSHNKEVHIGMGNSIDTPPMWVGKPTEQIFFKPPPSEVIVEAAEVKPPNSFPFLYKLLADASYIYGTEYGGGRIYKINRSTGAISQSTLGTFDRICGICDDATDSSRMWVYDTGASAYGTMFKVVKSTLAVESSWFVSAAPSLSTGCAISDIEMTTGYFWFGAFSPGLADLASVVWRVASSVTISSTLSNITPAFATGTGNWTGRSVRSNAVIKRNLCKLNSTTIGYAISLFQGSAPTTRPLTSYTLTAGGSIAPLSCLSVIADGSTFNTGRPLIVMWDGSYGGFPSGQLVSGCLYDGTRILQGVGNKLQRGAVSIPTLVGEAPTVTWETSPPNTYARALDVHSEPGCLSTDYFLSRLDSAPGVDRLTTNLVTYAPVVSSGMFGVTLASSGTSGVFSENTTYYYKLAMEYDGYQVSALGGAVATRTNGVATTDGIQVTLTGSSAELNGYRPTALLVFRASSPSSETKPSGYYRLVQTIKFSDTRWVINTTTKMPSYVFTDNVENTGASYEAHTGLSETLSNTIVHYELSTEVNGQLFVGRCYHPDLMDASHMVFRSKPSRYDTFDWSNDFVRFPTVPVAIVGFAGRLYVFDNADTYVVNPEHLYIEEVIRGVGALSKRSVTVFQNRLFVCDKNNIYMHDGQGFKPIGNAIRKKNFTGYSIGWQGFTHDADFPVICGFGQKNSVVVFVSAGATGKYLVYNLPKDRWDFWTPAFWGAENGLIPGKNGELYHSGSALYKVASDASQKKALTWYSQVLHLGDSSQNKRLYKLLLDYYGTPTISYALNSSETFSSLGTGGSISPVGTVGKVVGVKITIPEGTGYVRALSLLYRRLVGKR